MQMLADGQDTLATVTAWARWRGRARLPVRQRRLAQIAKAGRLEARWPTARQLPGTQDAALNELPRLATSRQFVPFHASTREPTARQLVLLTHDTSASAPSPGRPAGACRCQSEPFQVSMTSCGTAEPA